MLRSSTKMDIPNPFKNNEYKPIFLSSTVVDDEPSNVIKKDELNKRISEIEKNLEAVETLLNDSRSIIIEEDHPKNLLSRSRSYSTNPNNEDDMRQKILQLKHRLSSQKSLTDIRSEGDLSASGRLRHYRSTSIISDRMERQSKYAGSDYNDYVYSQSRTESNLDLLSLSGLKYEYTQKDQELKSNINALRDRLIRKRISDTALSLKAHPYLQTSTTRLNSSSLHRVSPPLQSEESFSNHNVNSDSYTNSSKNINKRLSVIEDSYERLISGETDITPDVNSNNKSLKRKSHFNKTNNDSNTISTSDSRKTPRRSLSYGYLRYSQYTNNKPSNKSNNNASTKEMISPQESTFSEVSSKSNITNKTSEDMNSSRRVLRMVKSIESMNSANVNFNNNKLVDKDKLAKVNEMKHISEKRVASLRKRLTTDGFGSIDSNTNSYQEFKKEQRKKHASSASLCNRKENSEIDVNSKIEGLKQQISQRKSENLSKTLSNHVLDPVAPRQPSRTSQYLKMFADQQRKEEEEEEEESKPEHYDEEEEEGKNIIGATKETEKSIEEPIKKPETIEDEETKSEENFEEIDDDDDKKIDNPQHNSETGQNTITTTVTNTSDQRNNVNINNNSISSTSRYSTSHEYTYMKPDIDTITQNLTYRKSAFAETEEEAKKLEVAESEQWNQVHNIGSVNKFEYEDDITEDEDENITKIQQRQSSLMDFGNDSFSVFEANIDNENQQEDELFDLPGFKNDNYQGVDRKLSVKGYKSHGKSHSIASNVSVMEQKINYRASFSNSMDLISPTVSIEDEQRDFFNNEDTFSTSRSNSKRNSRDVKHLQHKLSSKRSFNVLKQSIVETDYQNINNRIDDNSNDNSNNKKDTKIKHKVVPKRQKQKSNGGFFRKLAKLFKKRS